MRKIYAFGETVLDIIFENNQPKAAKPGGAMLNTSISLGRLKLPVQFISEFGKDHAGSIIENFLNTNGVFTQYVHRHSTGKSSLSLAFLDDKKNATYDFYKLSTEDHLQIEPPEIQQDDILLFGSHYARIPKIRPYLLQILKSAKANGAIIIYDPNARRSDIHKAEQIRPLIIENMSYATIVRTSDDDCEYIFGTKNAAETYAVIGEYCDTMIYTSSLEGATVIAPGIHVKVPSKKIKPVSTIGAGDNFNAGVIYSLVKERNIKESIKYLGADDWNEILQLGVEFSSEVCLRFDNYISKEFAMKYTE